MRLELKQYVSSFKDVLPASFPLARIELTVAKRVAICVAIVFAALALYAIAPRRKHKQEDTWNNGLIKPITTCFTQLFSSKEPAEWVAEWAVDYNGKTVRVLYNPQGGLCLYTDMKEKVYTSKHSVLILTSSPEPEEVFQRITTAIKAKGKEYELVVLEKGDCVRLWTVDDRTPF